MTHIMIAAVSPTVMEGGGHPSTGQDRASAMIWFTISIAVGVRTGTTTRDRAEIQPTASTSEAAR